MKLDLVHAADSGDAVERERARRCAGVASSHRATCRPAVARIAALPVSVLRLAIGCSYRERLDVVHQRQARA